MKIAVTGHTSGLGKALFDHYSNNGNIVSGFSRQTGFDLRDWSMLQKLLDLTENFDLLISNAKPDFFQTLLLYEMAKRSTRVSKVISIGSAIIDFEISDDQDVGINLYKTQKLALKDAHCQLVKKYKDFNSILVHPSHLYDSTDINYSRLDSWILRMEASINSNVAKEIYVK